MPEDLAAPCWSLPQAASGPALTATRDSKGFEAKEARCSAASRTSMENSGNERKSQTNDSKKLLWKTTIVCAIVVGTNVAGNYALARGLRHIGGIESWSPVPYIKAFVHFWIAVGVILMVIWLITRLLLLSWADLSYVLVVTSFSYVLSAVAGAVGLNESVTWIHWLGICLITLGVALVAYTPPHTTGHLEPEK